MKLNTLKADNWNKTKWCGPTALAIITGRTLKYCHNKLARLSWKKPQYLKSVGTSAMLAALSEMGYRTERITTTEWRPTLRRYIEEIQDTESFRSVVLVNVTGHCVVIQKGMVADNWRTTPMPVREHPSWRKQIRKMWMIQKR